MPGRKSISLAVDHWFCHLVKENKTQRKTVIVRQNQRRSLSCTAGTKSTANLVKMSMTQNYICIAYIIMLLYWHLLYMLYFIFMYILVLVIQMSDILIQENCTSPWGLSVISVKHFIYLWHEHNTVGYFTPNFYLCGQTNKTKYPSGWSC